MITVRIPVPSSALVVNLLGVLGLVGIVIAVGGLTNVWWAVLAGAVEALSLAVLASTQLQQAEQPAARPVAVSRSA